MLLSIIITIIMEEKEKERGLFSLAEEHILSLLRIEMRNKE